MLEKYDMGKNSYTKRIQEMFGPNGPQNHTELNRYLEDKKIDDVLKDIEQREAAKQDDFVCITSQGIMIKIELNDISVQGKAAMGVKVVNINKPDIVVGIARVIKEDEVQD